MTRRKPSQIRGGLPGRGGSAAERRAASWVHENSAHGFTPRRVREREPSASTSLAPRAYTPVKEYPVLARTGSRPGYYDHPDFRSVKEFLHPDPRVKLLDDKLGQHAVRLFGLEGTLERLRSVTSAAREVIRFSGWRVAEFTGGNRSFLGLTPDDTSRELLAQEVQTVSKALELKEPPYIRSLVVGTFESGSPAIAEARNLLNGYIESHLGEEHLQLSPPELRIKELQKLS